MKAVEDMSSQEVAAALLERGYDEKAARQRLRRQARVIADRIQADGRETPSYLVDVLEQTSGAVIAQLEGDE